jgi:hypothetical protein
VGPRAGLDAVVKRKIPFIDPAGSSTPIVQPVAQPDSVLPVSHVTLILMFWKLKSVEKLFLQTAAMFRIVQYFPLLIAKYSQDGEMFLVRFCILNISVIFVLKA